MKKVGLLILYRKDVNLEIKIEIYGYKCIKE